MSENKKKPLSKKILTLEAGQYPFKAGSGSLGEHRAKSKRVNSQLGKLSLTEKQAKILEFISNHISSVGFPPTVRQIAEYFNISAKAAHDHLKAIAKKGYLRLFPGHARGMEVMKNSNGDDLSSIDNINNTPLTELMRSVTIVPLIGTIAAGVPILAEENIDDKLTFPKAFLPTVGNMFALRIKGDSMEEAGIHDGDIAVLKQVSDFKTEVKNGDIVAAIIDGEATLKTFEKKGTKMRLLPANSNYSPIDLKATDFVRLAGILVGIFRSYR